MANSFVRYNGNGVLTQFSVTFPYIDRSHIEVSVGGTPAAFSWVNSTTVAVTPAPANGAVVELRRVTPSASPLVDFQDGAVVTEEQLDTNAKQALFVTQETEDDADDNLGKDSSDLQWNADSRRLKNVVDPTSSQDAATKNYVDTTTAASAAAAAASAAAAATSRNEAAAFADDASDSAAAALASAQSLYDTSNTSHTPSVASKVFTVTAGKSFGVGAWVQIASASAPAVWMSGQITAYTGTSLTVAVQAVGTATTKTDWLIWLAASPGSTGATGPGLVTGGTVGYPVLKKTGTDYDTEFAQLDTVGIKADAVTTAKILNANVTFAKLASDAANAKGARTISTSAASGGGTDGDIWYQV